MAINTNPGSPLRHAQSFVTSGTFTTPPTATLAFVSVHGATGGGGGSAGNRYYGPQQGGNSGPSIVASGFVELVPGGTHLVTIGAGGAPGNGATNQNVAGNAASAGGITIFDGAITANSSGGGSGGNRYGGGQATAGSNASASGTTTLTSSAVPNTAIIRTKSFTTQNTGGNAVGAGASTGRYAGNTGGTGSSGSVHIYL